MRLQLLPFQANAATQVHQWIAHGLATWRTTPVKTPSTVGLSAITGAGKTVIATAVIEAMLYGASEPMQVAPDPRAGFLWVTDDPALNRQTVMKMVAASNRLSFADIIIIDESFDQDMLDPGRLYVLNVQKLASSSSWVKPSEKRSHNLWDTIADTALAGDRDLVLIADEAHRGTKKKSDAETILMRLISGKHPTGRLAPAPVVWGISATIDEFEASMKQLDAHISLPLVTVSNDDVRASGLLKLTLVIDRPESKAETTVLREAVTQLAATTDAWRHYCTAQNEPVVRPALVFQVPDKVSDAVITEYVGIIEKAWVEAGQPALPSDSIVNVFGEHTDLNLGQRVVRYVAPETIAGAREITIVLAKEAITTGWDCPRAEVLFSLRPAKDATHIAQLIGRIVRAPLTRSIDDDTSLNSVYAYLPQFHAANLATVIDKITGKDTDTGIDVVVGKTDLTHNTAVPEAVFDAANGLPCWTAPSKPEPVLTRLFRLTSMLASDGFITDPHAQSVSKLTSTIDGAVAANKADFKNAKAGIETTSISRSTTDLTTGKSSTSVHTVMTDAVGLDAAYAAARKLLPEGVAQLYLAHLLADVSDPDQDDFDQARLTVSAAAHMPVVVQSVTDAAETLIHDFLESCRAQIKVASDAQQEAYRSVEASGGVPFQTALSIPDRGSAATGRILDKNVEPLPTYAKHLLADDKNLYPTRLNDWETRVLKHESKQTGFAGWYRNPSRASAAALQVAYLSNAEWLSMQPDFIAFYTSSDGTIRPVIIDPHGVHLGDARGKLVGLADYAERFEDHFARIEAVGVAATAKGAPLVYLDLLNADIRDAVRSWTDAEVIGLYALHGKPYAP